MKEAIEDHKGAIKIRHRNFYWECLSETDRDFDIKILAKRQLATSIKNYPEIKTFEVHFKRSHEYICKRINMDGKFNLWVDNYIMIENKNKFQEYFLNM